MLTGKIDQVFVDGEAGASASRLRVSLRQIEVFVATARGGSTRAGADRVSRSQSAASAALADLESALGVQLFDRVRRRLVLNENGRSLLPKAAALLDRTAELQHLFLSEHPAPLRIAASLTIGEVLLPPLLARWKVEHPASPVQLKIANTSEVIEAVASFDSDLGFIEGLQAHPDLVLHPWLWDDMVIVAAPQHALARRLEVVGVDALRHASWAMREPGSGTREAADRWLSEHVGQIDVAFELGSLEAIKHLVATGVALGCLSRHTVAQALDERSLVELRTILPPAARRLSIAIHKDKTLGRGTDGFLRLCSELAAAPSIPALAP
jgi:DNA-binding transcriptional LysR family regulator